VLLIIAIYMLLSLRGRFSIYILKLAYILMYNEAYKRVKKINEPIYLPVPLYYIMILF
jgi:hypothetical protein